MAHLFARMSNMFDPSMMMNADDMNFETQRSEFIHGCAGFAAGATAAVMLRLFARWQKSTSWSYDDLAIALSLIPLWALAGTGIGIALYGGLAEQAQMLTPEQAAVFYPSAFASYILYGLSITAAKLSILLLYNRIFTTVSFRRIIHTFMALCSIWCIVVVFAAFFRCNPVEASWTPHSWPGGNTSSQTETVSQDDSMSLKDTHIHTRNTMTSQQGTEASCLALDKLYYGTAITNLVLDVSINLLPARQIWSLHLSLKQRILLTLCMCVGVISIAAGIGRVLTIRSLAMDDLPATIAMPYLFLVVEPAFAIICACLPTYRPLAIWFGQRISHSAAGTKVKSLVSSSSSGSYPSQARSPTSSWSSMSPKSSPRPLLSHYHSTSSQQQQQQQQQQQRYPRGPRTTWFGTHHQDFPPISRYSRYAGLNEKRTIFGTVSEKASPALGGSRTWSCNGTRTIITSAGRDCDGRGRGIGMGASMGVGREKRSAAL